MTATKNVYALMLALVIVLSGCFGTTGTDSTDATSANNQTTWTGDIPNIAHSGNYTSNTGNLSGWVTLVSVETSPGEMLTVIETTKDGGSGSWLRSTCGEGVTVYSDGTAKAGAAPFSALDCTHELVTGNSPDYDSELVHWSFVYNISPVTVAATS